jgi:exosome complex component MTR3
METYRAQRAADAAPVLPAPLASSSDSFRPIFLRTGAVAQAAGSAYIECGRTKVLCAVHGPRRSTHTDNDAERGRVWCDFKFAPFAQTQRRRRGQDPDEREFSTLVAQALETSVLLHKFPKNVLEVYIMVLEDDGGAIATALSCASLALVDAGIEVYDMIAACNSVRTALNCFRISSYLSVI